MPQLRRRFVQLWERRDFSSRLPVAFCFSRDRQTNQLRCFSGKIRTVRRSRTFIGRSSVYGLVKSAELVPPAEELRHNPPARLNGRLLRNRILDRIARVPLADEPALSAERTAAAGGVVAAGGSESQPTDLI